MELVNGSYFMHGSGLLAVMTIFFSAFQISIISCYRATAYPVLDHLASFPGSCVGGVKSLVHTVCACSVTPGFMGLWKLADTMPQYHSIVLSFVARVQLKMVVLSEESGNEAKLVLMVFCHVDT